MNDTSFQTALWWINHKHSYDYTTYSMVLNVFEITMTRLLCRHYQRPFKADSPPCWPLATTSTSIASHPQWDGLTSPSSGESPLPFFKTVPLLWKLKWSFVRSTPSMSNAHSRDKSYPESTMSFRQCLILHNWRSSETPMSKQVANSELQWLIV